MVVNQLLCGGDVELLRGYGSDHGGSLCFARYAQQRPRVPLCEAALADGLLLLAAQPQQPQLVGHGGLGERHAICDLFLGHLVVIREGAEGGGHIEKVGLALS